MHRLCCVCLFGATTYKQVIPGLHVRFVGDVPVTGDDRITPSRSAVITFPDLETARHGAVALTAIRRMAVGENMTHGPRHCRTRWWH